MGGRADYPNCNNEDRRPNPMEEKMGGVPIAGGGDRAKYRCYIMLTRVSRYK